MPTEAELLPLITEAREDIGVEYKDWLDPTSNHGKATIARAAIALANYGGGYIVLGFAEEGDTLISHPRPAALPALTQDQANAAVRRYADPEFHVEFGRVAKIFAAENYALITGAPQSTGAASTPSEGFIGLNEADHQAVNRHCNVLFGEDYFGR